MLRGVVSSPSLMGRAIYYETKEKYDKSLADLNLVVVSLPEFMPALVEKARINMVMGNWEEARAVAHRVLQQDQMNIGALRIIVTFLLSQDSKQQLASSHMNDLIEALDKLEPRNANMFYSISRMYARLANRSHSLLQQTMSLVERAVRLDPNNSIYMSEHAYQLMLIGDYPQALRVYNTASKLDESNVGALHGRIKCKIRAGELKEAAQELGFLQEIESEGSNADLLFLDALLAWHLNKDEAKAVRLLGESVDAHLNKCATLLPGFDFYVAFDPEFIMEVAKELMQHIGTEPRQPSDPPNELLDRTVKLLQRLVSVVPGVLGSQLLLAKASYIAGDFQSCDRALAAVTRLDPQHAHAQMMQAHICLAREQYQQCAALLDQARALDFEVRNTPDYHLVKARLLQANGQLEDALKILEAAMALPGVKRAQPGASPLPLQDRISVFLELINCHAKLGHLPEAAQIMQQAKLEFGNTSEGARINMADADISVRRQDYDSALRILNEIPESSVYHTRAKAKSADIHLNHKRNKKMYAACYQQLASKHKTVHTHVLLGQAYMRIQEPELAIRAYKSALAMSPDDPNLASNIGQALLATHDYSRAVEYYETAVKGDAPKVYLRQQLAELYTQLGQYDAAIRVLEEALQSNGERDMDDMRAQTDDIQTHLLLANVYRESAATSGSMDSRDRELLKDALTAAYEMQNEVLSHIAHKDPDARMEQKDAASAICFQLAEYHNEITRDSDEAIRFYDQALKHNDSHVPSRLALAKIYFARSDMEACQQQCTTLNHIDPNNKEASMMLAGLMFKQNQPEAATYHFQMLLQKNPTRYDALNKLIQLLRRAGRLADAPRFIKLAERASPAANFAPGLHYCKGMHAWFTNNPNEALTHFNQARKDGEWGQHAIENMIEIYLNPDNTGLFAESSEAKGDNSEQVVAANQLLAELKNRGESTSKLTVLRAYATMAGKNKGSIESVCEELGVLLSNDTGYVPALLALANACMLLNQPPKARNHLKRINKMQVTPDFADEFEQAWLMLAQMYINTGKMDFAQELCQKVLANNKSSAKAWEQLGLIMEKEQSYRDAAENYERAWQYMNESSSQVGYKLAFNYLKAKRYVEAIDVCHKVLKAFPDYPGIKKDIMEKARASFRP